MRVLIVSYYFPPLGLAGTARPVALANFFAGRSDEVFVISVKPIAYPAYDKAMEAKVDPRVQIIRAGSTDPARIEHFLPMVSLKTLIGGKTKGALAASMFPDSKIGFVRGATGAVKKLLRQDVKTLLVTTSPPMSAHLVGLNSVESADITWVADFRDIWSSVPFSSGDAESQRRADGLYRQIFERAALVTATSQKTLRSFAEKFGAADKMMFLPNGYSETDFASPCQVDSGFIGIYGTLNHLIGFDRVAQWIGEFARRNPNVNFKLRHIGHLDLPEINDILDCAALKSRFQSTGYLPHPDAIAAIRKSAVNIVALSGQHDTSYVVPSKLWELLRAEPPLIVMLPKGNAAREIIEARNLPGVFMADDSQQLADALASALDVAPTHRSLRSAELCREFEWTSLAKGLAEQLNGMIL